MAQSQYRSGGALILISYRGLQIVTHRMDPHRVPVSPITSTKKKLQVQITLLFGCWDYLIYGKDKYFLTHLTKKTCYDIRWAFPVKLVLCEYKTTHWWYFNTGFSKGLVQSGNNPTPEPMWPRSTSLYGIHKQQWFYQITCGNGVWCKAPNTIVFRIISAH